MHESDYFNMANRPLQQGEAIAALNKLLPKKSTDLHDLSMFFIKKIFNSIERPLLYVFSLSLKTGVVPEKIKIAKIVPVFKSGDKKLVTNYRPISLLSGFSKILEKIVHTRLSNYLESNNRLSSSQFGFRRGHSTSHPATLLLNYISQSFNQNKHVAAVFCDLAKAFDTCDHKILLHTLQKKGIRGVELSWFKSYLSNRKQYVSLGGISSNEGLIKLGVPQGSILGPLLFIIYMDDLPSLINEPLFLFADDTVLLTSDSNIDTLMQKINSEFGKVCTFFRKYKLSLNPDKTNYLIFSNSKAIHDASTHVFIDNNNEGENDPGLIHEIKRINISDKVPAYKYLGIYLDPCLSFKYHLQKLSTKLSRAIYLLRTAKNILPNNAMKMLYYSIFHSHLTYATEIWSSATNSLLQEIFKKQKIAIRIINNASYNAHTQPLFKSNKILPLWDIITYTKAVYFQTIVQKKSPSSLHNVWLKNRDLRIRTGTYNRELRNDDDFHVPFSRTNQIERFPLSTFPKIWNELPAEITFIRKPTEFKEKIKTFLLEKIPQNFICNRLVCPTCHLIV